MPVRLLQVPATRRTTIPLSTLSTNPTVSPQSVRCINRFVVLLTSFNQELRDNDEEFVPSILHRITKQVDWACRLQEHPDYVNFSDGRKNLALLQLQLDEARRIKSVHEKRLNAIHKALVFLLDEELLRISVSGESELRQGTNKRVHFPVDYSSARILELLKKVEDIFRSIGDNCEAINADALQFRVDTMTDLFAKGEVILREVKHDTSTSADNSYSCP